MTTKGGLSKKAQPVQKGSRCKGIQGGTSKEEIKCVCLNARSIINKKNELNIMVEEISLYCAHICIHIHVIKQMITPKYLC